MPCQEHGPHPEGLPRVFKLGSDVERMKCFRHFSGNPRSLKWTAAEPGTRPAGTEHQETPAGVRWEVERKEQAEPEILRLSEWQAG